MLWGRGDTQYIRVSKSLYVTKQEMGAWVGESIPPIAHVWLQHIAFRQGNRAELTVTASYILDLVSYFSGKGKEEERGLNQVVGCWREEGADSPNQQKKTPPKKRS